MADDEMSQRRAEEMALAYCKWQIMRGKREDLFDPALLKREVRNFARGSGTTTREANKFFEMIFIDVALEELAAPRRKIKILNRVRGIRSLRSLFCRELRALV